MSLDELTRHAGHASPVASDTHKAGQHAFHQVIADICALKWDRISPEGLKRVAWAYYYFSIQFRENLEIARELRPDDPQLLELDRGERDTDNLSPWPGVAAVGEKMHHDEFMRRTLTLSAVPDAERAELEALGNSYLATVRAADRLSRAVSIASYEDGGLEAVFGAFLRAPDWNDPLLRAFEHFLVKHIEFDSDPDGGHGSLCRHLTPTDAILPLWASFRDMLVRAAPELR